MKTIKFLTVTALVALAMVFVSCSKDEVDTPIYSASGGSSHDLNNFEKAGLITLLETTKLHRDVYTWINSEYQADLFVQLAEREEKNLALLSVRVDKYGLENPVSDMLPGEFDNAAIQEEYNTFVSSATGDIVAMIDMARAMERDMIVAVEEQQATLSGNTDIANLYYTLICECNDQIQALIDDTKGFIGEYLPKPSVQEM